MSTINLIIFMIVIGVVALVIRVLKESEDRSISDNEEVAETAYHQPLEKSVKIYTAGSFPEVTSLNRLLENKDIIAHIVDKNAGQAEEIDDSDSGFEIYVDSVHEKEATEIIQKAVERARPKV
ncbi:MAG: hypothetical protein KAS70_02650 [Planctomycetes bacterium]|nr:hypothetical protein [Planctomycetota bacterium]